MKTTYKVTGSTAFQGHPPGETFDADLEPGLEKRAVARKAIRVVKRGDDKPKQEDEKDA